MNRKAVSGIMLTLLSISVLTLAFSFQPVTPEPYETRLHVRESPPGSWIPGVPAGNLSFVTIDIESPIAWDNTADGIVGWEFSVKVDPDVLEPDGAYAASSGYFLFDFIDWHNYTGHEPATLIGQINKTAGVMRYISELIFGWESLGVGAGGSSNSTSRYGSTYGLCRLRFRSKSLTAHTLIDIYDATWLDTDGTRHAFDVVDDGHYNEPPPLHNLTVESTPIDGIDFTINATGYTTNATVELAEGSYTVTMPDPWMDGPDQYNFVEWEDSSTNPTRVVSLTTNRTILANYTRALIPGDIDGDGDVDYNDLFILAQNYGENT